MRLSESTISSCSGICPPTRPVLPPCGTIAVPVSLASFNIADDLGHRRRPQHHRGVALEHVAHLDQIRRLQVRIGDGEFFADDRGEAREQGGVELFGLGNWRFIEHRSVSSGLLFRR